METLKSFRFLLVVNQKVMFDNYKPFSIYIILK